MITTISLPVKIVFGEGSVNPGKTYAEMAGEAATAALHDSGVEWKEVQAAYCSHSYAGTGAGSRVVDQLGTTGIPVYTIEEGCSGGAAANGMAFQAIASGLYDVVCAVGLEKMPKGILYPPLSRSPAVLWADAEAGAGKALGRGVRRGAVPQADASAVAVSELRAVPTAMGAGLLPALHDRVAR